MKVAKQVPLTNVTGSPGLRGLNRRHEDFLYTINSNDDILSLLNTYASTQASTLAADITAIDEYAGGLASTMDVLNTYASTQASTLSANITTVAAYASNVASGVSAAGFLAGESFLTAAFNVAAGASAAAAVTFGKTYATAPNVAVSYVRNPAISNYFNLFNGANNSVSFGSPTWLPVGDAARSLSLWVTYLTLANERMMVGWGTQGNNQMFSLSPLSAASGKISVWGYNHDTLGAVALVSGTEYHIVATYDPTTHALKTYVNNVVDINVSTGAYATGVTKLTYGYDTAFAAYANIKLHDVAVYSKALSADEVSTLFAKGSVSDGLVFNTIGNEASGNVIDVVSAHNGTVAGTTTSFYNVGSSDPTRVLAYVASTYTSGCLVALDNFHASLAATGKISGIVCK